MKNIKIDITSEITRLEKHLENNRRTILSARFGDGKTYFLREYITQHQIWKDYTPIDERTGSKEDTYFVVLHPVNYSVARNEDVFEYIKRDILVQLYQEGKLEDIDYKAIFTSIGDQLKEKALPMLGDLVSMLPSGNIIREIINLGVKIKTDYDTENKSASTFINSFTSEKGGLFEDDSYTKMIRKTLENLREPKGMESCKKVLIIEDLDRLDPAHMFRILNVIGAHIDIDKENDKFGFDNVILVMDYEVTRSIFHHFYGDKANYEGYISKFLSHNLFEYSLLRQAHQAFIQKIKDFCLLSEDDISQLFISQTNTGVPKSLRQCIENFSVRDITNILHDIDGGIIQEIRGDEASQYSTITPITRLLVILVRMQIKINIWELEKFFLQDPLRLSCLDGFLLVYPNLRYGMYEIGHNWYNFVFSKDENELAHMSVNIANGGNIVEFDIPRVVQEALSEAIPYVPDTQQLLK